MKVKFSTEQYAYVTSPDFGDTKLKACAGSGKTRTIIGRLSFLGKRMNPKYLYVVTFSRCAASDFRAKVKSLYPKGNHKLENYGTIDAMARAFLLFLESTKSGSVEIMTSAFCEALKTADDETIQKMKQFKDIRHLFVDEAQDLNVDQFTILKLLKKRFGTAIHLIGDPNQNIYQFRGSDSRYFLNWEAKEYELSVNFRSSAEIVAYSEYLKPHPSLPSQSRMGKIGIKPCMAMASDIILREMMIKQIKSYQGDLSEIAIISPTKGNKPWSRTGLSIYFNWLKYAGIPVNQMYDEKGRTDIVDYVKVPGKVNLATFHNTKGLEFDVVYVVDCTQNLMTRNPTADEHANYKYLLYVACSRAIREMYIWCIYERHKTTEFNAWLNDIRKELYRTKNFVIFSKGKFQEPAMDLNWPITEVIEKLSGSQLNTIFDLVTIESKGIKHYNPGRVFRGNDSALFGSYCEQLLYLQYRLANHLPRPKIQLIENIIHNKLIPVRQISLLTKLQRMALKRYEWDMVDSLGDVQLKRFLDSVCDRSIPFHHHLFANDVFIGTIKSNRANITLAYDTYLNSDITDWKQIYKHLFYLVVIIHAYETSHHYHINHQGKTKQYLLKNQKLFDAMSKYVTETLSKETLQMEIPVTKDKFQGIIDVISDETIIEIKCVSSVSIRHYLQLFLYGYCTDFRNDHNYRIINILTGNEYVLKITSDNLPRILQIIQDVYIESTIPDVVSHINAMRI